MLTKLTTVKTNSDRFRTNPKFPTFWEFVQFVIESSKINAFDPHWKPQANLCSICSVNYDLIGQFENFDEEATFIFNELNILDKMSDENLKLPANQTNVSKEKTQIYFSMISDEDIMKMYNIYKLDFDLFGYTFKIRNISIDKWEPENV